jgi:acetolactate synthase-1/2/3 large subunit
VTGGFAMHLNDSFGSKLDVVYTHGECPAGYSAIGYSKVTKTPSVVCVTAGCGETNSATPCMVAYQDSVPVFFISGGVPHKESIRWKRLQEKKVVRTYSGSDNDVMEMVKGITKYSCVVWEVERLRYYLEKCIHTMTDGVPGPVWMSVPLDIQGMECHLETPLRLTKCVNHYMYTKFPFDKWEKAQRPVILVGNGVYLSNTKAEFKKFVDTHKVPVVSTFFATDAVPEYNLGRVGILGDRTGNFVIQNADFILNLGSRLSKSVVGYRQDWFAREATIVSINLEKLEFGNTIIMDLKNFFSEVEVPVKEGNQVWLDKTMGWKHKWFRELPNPESESCPYTFLNRFYDKKPNGGICVASSGSIFCVNWHQFLNKGDDEFIISSHGDMGFELPCSVGCSIASEKTVYCVVGDGSFQFNFQELQTIKTLSLRVKILYFNNGGYGAIKITQDSYFKRRFGVDVVCPDVKKICDVYSLKYFQQDELDEMFAFDGPCLIECVCDVQARHPKLSNLMREDGTFENKPLEDMAPFLDRDEFQREMCIKQVDTQ